MRGRAFIARLSNLQELSTGMWYRGIIMAGCIYRGSGRSDRSALKKHSRLSGGQSDEKITCATRKSGSQAFTPRAEMTAWVKAPFEVSRIEFSTSRSSIRSPLSLIWEPPVIRSSVRIAPSSRHRPKSPVRYTVFHPWTICSATLRMSGMKFSLVSSSLR